MVKKALCCIRQNDAVIDILWYYIYCMNVCVCLCVLVSQEELCIIQGQGMSYYET